MSIIENTGIAADIAVKPLPKIAIGGMESPLMTVEEASGLYETNERHLNMILSRGGEIDFIQLGSERYIFRRSFDKFLKFHEEMSCELDEIVRENQEMGLYD